MRFAAHQNWTPVETKNHSPDTVLRRAAQYIRMSTDRQDLSPAIQKDGIAAFAAANKLEVVASYEDEGKSGVEVANRPKLRQLLRDVSEGASFAQILVYDVSRWGRFQDADAAAYYEYHCRLHGVQVTYVSESFNNDHAPASVLVKSMKRMMAAEYSRDLACKARAGQERVIAMGFHMGALPPLGYRRFSVSADGARRVRLEHGERKAALTDRIEWVLGPTAEVTLVRRICSAYAAGRTLEEICGLVSAEGWCTEKGRQVSVQSLKLLLKHEALIGNFVWGTKSKGGKIIKSTPTRMNGSVPRIIDDATWTAVQRRLQTAVRRSEADEAGTTRTVRALRPRQLRLALEDPAPDSYRRSLGSPCELRNHTRDFGAALRTALGAAGMPAAFDRRTNVLTFWGVRFRIRLMWPTAPQTWLLERRKSVTQVEHILIARMEALYHPLDFFIVPPAIERSLTRRSLERRVPGDLKRFWCQSGEDVARRLSARFASS